MFPLSFVIMWLYASKEPIACGFQNVKRSVRFLRLLELRLYVWHLYHFIFVFDRCRRQKHRCFLRLEKKIIEKALWNVDNVPEEKICGCCIQTPTKADTNLGVCEKVVPRCCCKTDLWAAFLEAQMIRHLFCQKWIVWIATKTANYLKVWFKHMSNFCLIIACRWTLITQKSLFFEKISLRCLVTCSCFKVQTHSLSVGSVFTSNSRAQIFVNLLWFCKCVTITIARSYFGWCRKRVEGYCLQRQ